MFRCGCGHGEAVRLGDPSGDDRQEGQRDQREGEDPPEPERARCEAVEDRGEPGPDPVAGGHERNCLGPIGRPGLLGGEHGSEGVGRAQEWPPEREDHDEPPVARTGGRHRGHREPDADRDQQHRSTTEPIGQPGEGEGAERGQADGGQSDAERSSRESGLVGDRRPLPRPTELLGHAAEGGDHTELTEPGGEGRDDHPDDDRVDPAVEVQGRGRARRRLRRGHGGQPAFPASRRGQPGPSSRRPVVRSLRVTPAGRRPRAGWSPLGSPPTRRVWSPAAQPWPDGRGPGCDSDA